METLVEVFIQLDDEVIGFSTDSPGPKNPIPVTHPLYDQMCEHILDLKDGEMTMITRLRFRWATNYGPWITSVFVWCTSMHRWVRTDEGTAAGSDK